MVLDGSVLVSLAMGPVDSSGSPRGSLRLAGSESSWVQLSLDGLFGSRWDLLALARISFVSLGLAVPCLT
jgi:hypothetical protein